jgi:hypothetical protein
LITQRRIAEREGTSQKTVPRVINRDPLVNPDWTADRRLAGVAGARMSSCRL